MTRDWTPVLRGAAYCSPACGFGCAKKAFARATKEADTLAARMGGGWEPEVWENCGWHYAVTKGVARIVPTLGSGGGSLTGTWRVEGYLVFFNSSHQVVADAKTPEDALGFALQDARTIERRIAADCAALAA